MTNLQSNASRLKKLVPPKPLFGSTGIENDDGSYTVRGDTPGYVWVRIEPDGAPKEVLNIQTGADRLHNLRVKMEYNDDGELEIVKVVRQTNDYVSAEVTAHYNAPSMVSDLRQDVLPNRLLKALRPRVDDDGGLVVYVEPGLYVWNGTIQKFEGANITFAASGTSGYKTPYVFGIDGATNTLDSASGTDVLSYFELGDDDFLDLIGSETFYVIGGVAITNGQTAITQDDIVDLRTINVSATSLISQAVILAPNSATRNQITPTGDYPTLRTRRYSSGQTSNIHEWTTEASSVLARIDKSGNAYVNRLEFPAASELTIASGVITCTAGYHTVDTEGDTSSDDLDTINGVGEGVIVCLRASNTSRTVVVKNGTNIKTNTGGDIALDDDNKWVMFIGKGGGVVLALSGGGGGGSVAASSVTYTPVDSGDWNVVPTVASDALDELASRVETAESDIASLSAGGISSAGWVAAGETWTYASADDPTFTFTVSGDVTTKYSAGMRVRLVQTTTKYFIITAVSYSAPNTTVTIYGGTDYDLANAAISSPNFSVVKAPYGFPLDPTKWTVEVSDTTQRTQATPTINVWYNLGSFSMSIPIGIWDVSYSVIAEPNDGSSTGWNVWATLSTANNSESDNGFTAIGRATGTVSILDFTLSRTKTITLAAKTTYYLNTRTTNSNLDNVHNRNDLIPAIIRARCVYL